MGPEGPAQREGYKRLAERERVARWSVFGKLTGLARICPHPQALHERPERLLEHEGHARFPGESTSLP